MRREERRASPTATPTVKPTKSEKATPAAPTTSPTKAAYIPQLHQPQPPLWEQLACLNRVADVAVASSCLGQLMLLITIMRASLCACPASISARRAVHDACLWAASCTWVRIHGSPRWQWSTSSRSVLIINPHGNTSMHLNASLSATTHHPPTHVVICPPPTNTCCDLPTTHQHML